MTHSLSPALLGNYIQSFDGALDAQLCEQMLQSFHSLARFHKPNGKGHRVGLEASAWTELDIGPLSDQHFRNMLHANMLQHLQHYNQALNLSLAIPETQKISELIIKRYRPNTDENFQPHFDSLGAVSNRYLVFIWYLNDVDTGGETRFVDLDISIQPKAGRLLIFPPYWMFQHEGRPPISGDKYILSTYFLF